MHQTDIARHVRENGAGPSGTVHRAELWCPNLCDGTSGAAPTPVPRVPHGPVVHPDVTTLVATTMIPRPVTAAVVHRPVILRLAREEIKRYRLSAGERSPRRLQSWHVSVVKTAMEWCGYLVASGPSEQHRLTVAVVIRFRLEVGPASPPRGIAATVHDAGTDSTTAIMPLSSWSRMWQW